jgi:hypothetical protein
MKAGATVDGERWTAERGRDGDLLMEHPLGRFHLDAGATCLRCAPADLDDPAWRRLLLDTALVTASLSRGHEALHAGCVVNDGNAVAIAGASGAGKTTMLLELLRAGARFLSDDVIALREEPGQVVAQPGPPVANLPATESAGELVVHLHRLQDEWWVRVRNPWSAPAPIRAILVLARGEHPNEGPAVSRLSEPAGPLLQHALRGGSSAQRLQQRFDLLARLASSAEVLTVTVTPALAPRELAEEVIQAVPALQA